MLQMQISVFAVKLLNTVFKIHFVKFIMIIICADPAVMGVLDSGFGSLTLPLVRFLSGICCYRRVERYLSFLNALELTTV